MGRTGESGAVEVVADIGRLTKMEDNDVALICNIADIHLDKDIDVMILGSSGFWYVPTTQRLSCSPKEPASAMLRKGAPFEPLGKISISL